MVPEMEVTIFEKQQRVLAKVEISGGGRCNCTNTFAGIKDLSAVYPRGHRLMKRLMKSFNQRDSYLWFERHGVRLTIQDDGCVFPASQDSHSIINCFLMSAQRLGIMINRGCSVTSLDSLNSFDFVVVTTGGSPRPEGLRWLMDKGHDIANPVPSLFSFRIDDTSLQALMGTVVENTIAYIPGANLRADGALLITHWGMSGPAILKLSSYAARLLAEHGYQLPMAVNWTAMHDAEVFAELESFAVRHSQKQLSTINPFGLPARLWSYLVCKCLGERANGRWDSLNKKELNRLANLMSGGDTYQIAGRAPFKDEFVTCGGVTLSSVNPSTLESRSMTGLYFAGEVLDIDGVTGGFNFQAAWTTAYTVALSIARKVKENKVI
jgi:predicted Rossmann fold flavoprotein